MISEKMTAAAMMVTSAAQAERYIMATHMPPCLIEDNDGMGENQGRRFVGLRTGSGKQVGGFVQKKEAAWR